MNGMNWTEADYEAFKLRQNRTEHSQNEANDSKPIPQATPKKNKAPKEDIEQLAVVRYLEMKGINFFHVPNGGMRNVIVAKKLKAQGVKAGVPDIIITDAPPYHHTAPGAAIEMKRVKGGIISENQKEWLQHLENRGWHCKVAKGAEEAISFLKLLGF